jgi:hypothetical protein
MTITVSTKTYSQDRIAPDAIAYTGPANTLAVQDVIEFKRTYPKPVGTFGGMARPSLRLVRTVVLNATAATTALASLTITGAIPVGISSSDLAALIADAVDVLQLEEAATTKVISGLDITY